MRPSSLRPGAPLSALGGPPLIAGAGSSVRSELYPRLVRFSRQVGAGPSVARSRIPLPARRAVVRPLRLGNLFPDRLRRWLEDLVSPLAGNSGVRPSRLAAGRLGAICGEIAGSDDRGIAGPPRNPELTLDRRPSHRRRCRDVPQPYRPPLRSDYPGRCRHAHLSPTVETVFLESISRVRPSSWRHWLSPRHSYA